MAALRQGPRSRVPKDAKKARKSAALIIAEKDIGELKADVATIFSLLRWIAGGVGTLVLSLAGYVLQHFLSR